MVISLMLWAPTASKSDMILVSSVAGRFLSACTNIGWLGSFASLAAIKSGSRSKLTILSSKAITWFLLMLTRRLLLGISCGLCALGKSIGSRLLGEKLPVKTKNMSNRKTTLIMGRKLMGLIVREGRLANIRGHRNEKTVVMNRNSIWWQPWNQDDWPWHTQKN